MMSGIFSRALGSGVLAALASAGVLALCARRSGAAAVQPINATSHVVHGAAAAGTARIDFRHTGLGAATHLGACCFWALLFEAMRSRARTRPAVLDAAATVAIAAAVDYGLVPRRLTPGWELLLGRRGIGAGYVGMALGFVVAAMLRAPRGAEGSSRQAASWPRGPSEDRP